MTPLEEVRFAERIFALCVRHGAGRGRGFFVVGRRGEPVPGVDSSLYGGYAGFMLFALGLYRATGKREYRRWVAELAHRIEAFLEAAPAYRKAGYHTGLGGTLHVLQLAGDLAPSSAADAVVERLRSGSPMDGGSVDFVGGAAGAIAGSVPFLAADARLGGQLMQAGLRVVLQSLRLAPRSIWCAQTTRIMADGESHARLMSGLAHGHSGLAYALFVAGTQLDAPILADIALELLREEDATFDRKRSNWIGRRGRDEIGMYAWCYGYVGALLVRLHARRWGYASDCLVRACAMLSPTHRRSGSLERFVASAGPSLCHGGGALLLAKNFLRREGLELPSRFEVLREQYIRDGLARGTFRFGTRAAAWDNTLFNGAAGIGLLCLRDYLDDAFVLLPCSERSRSPTVRGSAAAAARAVADTLLLGLPGRRAAPARMRTLLKTALEDRPRSASLALACKAWKAVAGRNGAGFTGPDGPRELHFVAARRRRAIVLVLGGRVVAKAVGPAFYREAKRDKNFAARLGLTDRPAAR